ncbi:MAG: AAA family ATPase [Rhodoferax sp.]
MSAPGVYLVGGAPAQGADADLPPYAAALGLRSNPFPVTPDETHYFFTPETEAIYEEVAHFIEMRKGFLLFTGDIGLGKTTLLRRLLTSFDKARYNTALVLTSFLDQTELLETIARDFGLQLPANARRIDHLAALNQFLLAESAKGKINVLFIDDAQALDAQALDVVRQLSNLETAQSKLIQVVLCGQPELLETLDQHGLRQVKSRIALHRQLQPLSRQQTQDYIVHRLTQAGGADCVQIASDGLQSMHELTAGFPRRIHHLMDRCLYGLMASDSTLVDRALVLRAQHDLGWQACATTLPLANPLPAPQDVALARPSAWRRHSALIFMLLALSIAAAFSAWRVISDLRPYAPDQFSTGAPEPAADGRPALIAAPDNWKSARSAFAGLATLDWPAASSIAALTAQLQGSAQMQPWQVVLGQGDWVQPCQARPMLAVRDAQGALWRMSFVESKWPLAPVAMGQSTAPVQQLQQFLATQGLLDGAQVDTIMGPRTAYALSQFQREQGLSSTGQFSPDTAYRLSCALAHGPKSAGSKAP